MNNKKTYHIVTIGCQMNKSDSERIASYLEDLGYRKTVDKQSANILVVTTCGVRQTAENRIYGLIPIIKKNNPHNITVLTGCLSGREDVKRRLKKTVDIWLPISDLPNLENYISFYQGNKKLAQTKKDSYLRIKPKVDSKFSVYIPIGNGCNNYCSYCVVPYARGREVYRPASEILNEARYFIEKGYKEIILIAQNVNSYISPNEKNVHEKEKINFSKLLKMVDDIPGDFWIRFSTSHPKDMSDELIDMVATGKKICKHIHLPAQAGDNTVLENMNRKYSVEHYNKLIKKIKNKIKNVSITSDIIVGFPGETEEQFNKTVELLKNVKFDVVFISPYSPRPGTLAEKMRDDVSATEKKKRVDILTDIYKKTSNENNKKYLNKSFKILIDSKKKGFYYGKTGTGKVIKILNPTENMSIGVFAKVFIKHVKDSGIEGEI